MKKIEAQINAIVKRSQDKELEYESAITKAKEQLTAAQKRMDEAQEAIDHEQYIAADDAVRCAQRDLKFYETGLNKIRETPEANREEIQRITDAIRSKEREQAESCTKQMRELAQQLLTACEELQQLISMNDRLREKWTRNVLKEKAPLDRSAEARIFAGQTIGTVKGICRKTEYIYDKREDLFGNMF